MRLTTLFEIGCSILDTSTISNFYPKTTTVAANMTIKTVGLHVDKETGVVLKSF